MLIIPKQDTPGGFCTVTIDQNGAVTGFYGGA
ncbi:hypothetical protein DSM3645_03753 [Blastopirellula marina DSM 3645]|uniref:Uncharacterized protein n=1 Tax=Blastopirellula marina DSM 3645 TaxID=314230 RepID=A3ZW62_9BACT|nr:hypothetical protein DSM3645_03753 [Blastopirellula marina DSM 3645]